MSWHSVMGSHLPLSSMRPWRWGLSGETTEPLAAENVYYVVEAQLGLDRS